jgi:hypothetical protein
VPKNALLTLVIKQYFQSWCDLDQLFMLHLIYKMTVVCITCISMAMFSRRWPLPQQCVVLHTTEAAGVFTPELAVLGSTITATQAGRLSTVKYG